MLPPISRKGHTSAATMRIESNFVKICVTKFVSVVQDFNSELKLIFVLYKKKPVGGDTPTTKAHCKLWIEKYLRSLADVIFT